MDSSTVSLRRADRGPGEACEAVLRSLPNWFGIESSLLEYVEHLQTMPTVLAEVEGLIVGFVALKLHYDHSAELYVLGLRPEFHRRGIGRMMIAESEDWLRERGVRWLQVKTMGPSRPDEHYATTMRFYTAVGFEELEEISGLWGELPCLIFVKRLDGPV